jgi:hypothetical protein
MLLSTRDHYSLVLDEVPAKQPVVELFNALISIAILFDNHVYFIDYINLSTVYIYTTVTTDFTTVRYCVFTTLEQWLEDITANCVHKQRQWSSRSGP